MHTFCPFQPLLFSLSLFLSVFLSLPPCVVCVCPPSRAHPDDTPAEIGTVFVRICFSMPPHDHQFQFLATFALMYYTIFMGEGRCWIMCGVDYFTPFLPKLRTRLLQFFMILFPSRANLVSKSTLMQHHFRLLNTRSNDRECPCSESP